MAALALRVSGADKAFARDGARHEVFRDIGLEVRTGEIVALLGPSGCGKSTLLRTIAGLEPLDAGHITFADGHASGHRVGIGFQEPSLLPWLTVAGNVGLGARFAANRTDRSGDPGDVTRDVLIELGLEAVADAFPDELSGGQAQRANVARVVATGRPILLLDEPFAALDPVTRADLQAWLLSLRRTRRLTIVVVTHDVAEALRLGDRIALMRGSPGTIAHIWEVPDRDARLLENLRRRILDAYDPDRGAEATESPEVPSKITPVPPTAIPSMVADPQGAPR